MSIVYLICFGLLFWSFNLMESDLKDIKRQLNAIKRMRFTASSGMQTGKQDPYESNFADSSYKNLLKPDPYYETILPKMLPENFEPIGNFKQGTIGKPEHLHPFVQWADFSDWLGWCSLSLAKRHVGYTQRFAPSAAWKVEERPIEGGQGTEFWVHLRKDIFWQPLDESFASEGIELSESFYQKVPVTAHDFKLYFDAVMNPYVSHGNVVALRNYIGDIEEFKVLDDTTFVVRWKQELDPDTGRFLHKYSAKNITLGLQPLASHIYKYYADGKKIIPNDEAKNSYRMSTVWAQVFSQHWASQLIPSCGPWKFDGITDESIRFVRNPDHFNFYDALTRERTVYFRITQDSIWNDFKAQGIDLLALNSDRLDDYNKFLESKEYQEQKIEGKGVLTLDYLQNAYRYIGWNQEQVIFQQPEVRKALNLAINKEWILANLLKGHGELFAGPFHPLSPSYDKSIQLHNYDLFDARQTLLRSGWKEDPESSILYKQIGDAREYLQFNLLYFVKDDLAKRLCQFIADTFKEINVQCNLVGAEIADLSSKIQDREFDALYLGWGLGTPPEDPRQLWHSMYADQKGSSNHIAYSNKDADKIMDKLVYEDDESERVNLYHRFHQIIYDDNPYAFLFIPKLKVAYRSIIKNFFIPAEDDELFPGSDTAQPDINLIWFDH